MDKKAVIEGLKEFLRIEVLAVMPVLISSVNEVTGEISIDWRVVVAVLILGALRGFDRWMHKDPGIAGNGLVPF